MTCHDSWSRPCAAQNMHLWPRSAACGLLAVLGSLSGCWSEPAPPRRPAVVRIANVENDDRRADVIFVHGLGSDDLSAFTCESTKMFFPQALGNELKEFGFWTVNYAASPHEWMGPTMPIVDRSKTLLQELTNHKLGDRPIIFVAHSMGGLIVKQMLRDASTLQNDAWRDILDQTRGVVLLATPNTGSDLALFADRLSRVLGFSDTKEELKKNAPALRDLNIWYRNNVPDLQIKSLVFCESPLAGRLLVVDESSGDPGLAGVVPLKVDADHLTIAKPCTDSDLVYMSTREFVAEDVCPLPTRWDISLAEFTVQFNVVRNDPLRFAAFKAEHVHQEVAWEAVVRNVSPDRKEPTYALAVSQNSPASDFVIANFAPRRFNDKLAPGARVHVRGILKDSTNQLGAILDRCKLTGADGQ